MTAQRQDTKKVQIHTHTQDSTVADRHTYTYTNDCTHSDTHMHTHTNTYTHTYLSGDVVSPNYHVFLGDATDLIRHGKHS